MGAAAVVVIAGGLVQVVVLLVLFGKFAALVQKAADVPPGAKIRLGSLWWTLEIDRSGESSSEGDPAPLSATPANQ